MAKKTVLKRAIKTYVHDPDLQELLSLDDGHSIDTTATPVRGVCKAKPIGLEHKIDEPQHETEVETVEDEQPPANDYFGHCDSLESVVKTHKDILLNDPTMEMAPGYIEAYKQAHARFKGDK